LWLQGHTARASLLCSVGKIFHCVHYLSAAPRTKASSWTTMTILRLTVVLSLLSEVAHYAVRHQVQ